VFADGEYLRRVASGTFGISPQASKAAGRADWNRLFQKVLPTLRPERRLIIDAQECRFSAFSIALARTGKSFRPPSSSRDDHARLSPDKLDLFSAN
jgi:hypothetical protein